MEVTVETLEGMEFSIEVEYLSETVVQVKQKIQQYLAAFINPILMISIDHLNLYINGLAMLDDNMILRNNPYGLHHRSRLQLRLIHQPPPLPQDQDEDDHNLNHQILPPLDQDNHHHLLDDRLHHQIIQPRPHRLLDHNRLHHLLDDDRLLHQQQIIPPPRQHHHHLNDQPGAAASLILFSGIALKIRLIINVQGLRTPYCHLEMETTDTVDQLKQKILQVIISGPLPLIITRHFRLVNSSGNELLADENATLGRYGIGHLSVVNVMLVPPPPHRFRGDPHPAIIIK